MKIQMLFILCLVACNATTNQTKTVTLEEVLGEGLTPIDYSFGQESIQAIQRQILREEYETVTSICIKKPSDWFTQTVDALALNLPETYLQKWLIEATEKEFPTLVLGAHYAHKAWVVRGYSYARDVKEEDALGFDDYQNKAIELLTTVQKEKIVVVDAAARLIRIYMGKSDKEQVEYYFSKCQELDKNHLWSYIHYSEAIQPKWLGSLEEVETFMGELPQRTLIAQIITLKMMNDSFIAGQNYVEKETSSLKETASRLVHRIDRAVRQKAPSTVQKHVLYNYLALLAEQVGNQTLLERYFLKMHDNYTLYPSGIILE